MLIMPIFILFINIYILFSLQETILELLRDAMIKKVDCKGFLIDGFPRDIPQGQQFENTVSFR